MAERRMFSKTIIDSDLFLDMPMSAQLLYFHLGMRADDDGFVSSPRKIQRLIGCNDDDMRVLIAKQFVITFEIGVIVIRHWKAHNYIRTDRYKKTVYSSELSTLNVDENGVYYSLGIPNNNQLTTNGIPRLGKDRLGKDSIDNNMSTDVDEKSQKSVDYKQIIDVFNRVCKSLPKVQAVTDKRKKAIKAAQQTVDEFGGWEKLFETVEQSDFLSGRSGAWSGCGFDWILKPANLTKIIEGNYSNGRNAKTSKTPDFRDPNNYEEKNVNYDEIFRTV